MEDLNQARPFLDAISYIFFFPWNKVRALHAYLQQYMCCISVLIW